ncbi:uncharacterized protein LOC143362785 [Halictus rubicundus]|uniref:uncharacterized protein LOC143362785 n=1 Tax=Halictus rubicundus TaxID=77578 RepID=UPI00403663D2
MLVYKLPVPQPQTFNARSFCAHNSETHPEPEKPAAMNQIIAFVGLAALVGVACASHLDEDHGHSTYEEKSQPVEIPIYKKYAIPIPHPVPVQVPQKIEIPIPQPQNVPIEIPQPYPVEVIKHVEIPVEKPEPVVVEKHVPFVVEKPYPVYVEKKFPIPVAKPYPVHVPIYKHVFHYSSKGKGWH